MRYISTRGQAPPLGFEDVLLAGLARDGGLYVPEAWPHLDAEAFRALRGRPYAEVAARVMAPFVGDAFTEAELYGFARDAYAGFGHAAVAPLVQIDRRLWLLELFHGPTLAFKDMAMQMLGRLFDAVLARRRQRIVIVGATSGDTGSAAIEACRDRASVDVVILYPQGRVSEVQRRQMTTVGSANISTAAIEGSFDDCQDLVKAMFADQAFRDEMNLSAVNSINWARILAQIVYYVAAGTALGAPDRPVSFAVPTGNFGNVYAAYAARAIGLPVAKLVVGTNRNDILDRFFRTGTMRTEAVVPTTSPSMDIQISSNLERLLFDLFDRDGGALASAMTSFRAEGRLAASAPQMDRARNLFASARFDDDEVAALIAATRSGAGLLLDPHSAIGVGAARAALAEDPDGDTPVVALATAHPAKFPDAVERAAGVRPALPERLASLYDRPERVAVLPNDLGAVQAFVASRVRERQAA